MTVDGITPIETAPQVAALFPDNRVEVRRVVAHAGHRGSRETVAAMERQQNLYADLTPVVHEPVAIDPDVAERLATRLLFGSDSPNTGFTTEALLRWLDSLALSAAARDAILGGTARSLIAVA